MTATGLVRQISCDPGGRQRLLLGSFVRSRAILEVVDDCYWARSSDLVRAWRSSTTATGSFVRSRAIRELA
jgi:hypothetical protein